MIWIDLENKVPTANIPNWDPSARTQQWVPWSQAQWDAWLVDSERLVDELAKLDAAGKSKERNDFIDNNKPHWDKLKPWLHALSGGKCWFSEVREEYSHYDVEHFRPKKEAKSIDATKRDGYWWLAFDYMNLRLCGNVGNRKKGGWFPLKEGSLYSTYDAQCEESESAYLLDPIDDSDVELIAFDEEGKVIAMPGVSEWEQRRVEETVKRLKLNEHTPLAEARRKVWSKMDRLINDYERAKSRCQIGVNPAAKEKLRQVRAQVREMTQSTAELSAVAKWCVLFRNDAQLSKLVA